MDFLGTTGDDNFKGTPDNDFFDMSQGGDDTVVGSHSTDQFYFGAAFTADDAVDGGKQNHDALILQGDYSAGVVFGATTMTNIENMTLNGGFSYNFTLNAANVGGVLDVDAKMGAGDTLTFDASAAGHTVNIVTSAGTNVLKGGSANDTFTVTSAGTNFLEGGGSNDNFDFGATFDANDHVDGGAGTNYVVLRGDYNLVLDGTTGANIVNAALHAVGQSNFRFTLTDDYIGAGQTKTIDSSLAKQLTIDASAEIDGGLIVHTSASNANITMGGGDDVITSYSSNSTLNLQSGGDDTVFANYSLTTVNMGASLTSADQLQGPDRGYGLTVNLDGDYSAGIVFNATTMVNVNSLNLAAGNSYKFTTVDANLTRGHTMSVDAHTLLAGSSLYFDASAERRGRLFILGGGGDDTILVGGGRDNLSGGWGNDTIARASGSGIGKDTIFGGGGGDWLNGGSDRDKFVYKATHDSSGIHYDTIEGFNTFNDTFFLPKSVSGIDPKVTGGGLDADKRVVLAWLWGVPDTLAWTYERDWLQSKFEGGRFTTSGGLTVDVDTHAPLTESETQLLADHIRRWPDLAHLALWPGPQPRRKPRLLPHHKGQTELPAFVD